MFLTRKVRLLRISHSMRMETVYFTLHVSGVMWILSGTSSLRDVIQIFRIRRSLIISNDFLWQAMCRGVLPSLFWRFGSHRLLDSSWDIEGVAKLTLVSDQDIIGLLSLLTAMCRGVSPFSFWAFGLHSSEDSKRGIKRIWQCSEWEWWYSSTLCLWSPNL